MWRKLDFNVLLYPQNEKNDGSLYLIYIYEKNFIVIDRRDFHVVRTGSIGG